MKLIVKCVADDGSEWETIEEAQARDAEIKAARLSSLEANLRDKLRAKSERELAEFDRKIQGPDATPVVP